MLGSDCTPKYQKVRQIDERSESLTGFGCREIMDDVFDAGHCAIPIDVSMYC